MKDLQKESWDALQNKIAEAEELASAENADANDVEIMKRELSKSNDISHFRGQGNFRSRTGQSG